MQAGLQERKAEIELQGYNVVNLSLHSERPIRAACKPGIRKDKVLRVVLYAEDTTLARRIVNKMEQDRRCELIALCTNLGDLNFVLDHVTVDVLYLQLTPETGEDVLCALWGRTRSAPLLVQVQFCIGRQFPAPEDLGVARQKLQPTRRDGERGRWASLSPMPQSELTWRTAKDIMGAEAYRGSDRTGRPGDDSRWSTLA